MYNTLILHKMPGFPGIFLAAESTIAFLLRQKETALHPFDKNNVVKLDAV